MQALRLRCVLSYTLDGWVRPCRVLVLQSTEERPLAKGWYSHRSAQTR